MKVARAALVAALGSTMVARPPLGVPIAPHHDIQWQQPAASEHGEPIGGYTDTNGQITLRPGASRYEQAHEMGHALDFEVLTNRDRARFQRIMGAPKGDWRTGGGYLNGGMQSPSEWFGDYYAASALGINPNRQSVTNYTQIDPARLRRFTHSLERLRERRGLDYFSTSALR